MATSQLSTAWRMEAYRALIERAGVPPMPHASSSSRWFVQYGTYVSVSTFLDNCERIGEKDLIGQSIRMSYAGQIHGCRLSMEPYYLFQP
jgi:hypothetical protein